MQFEPNHLYHIYNQGNNRQKIFFERENYLFFLRKVRAQMLPYCDILAYCLMPNHFHFMVRVNRVEVEVVASGGVQLRKGSDRMTSSHPITIRTFNQSIATLLRSYTRAINKQEETYGSLFRQKTKAECLNCPNGTTPSFFNTNSGTQINIQDPTRTYQQICFDYIYNNPVEAGLVHRATDWEYSSAQDYAGQRNGTLINKELAKEYVTIDLK